MDGGIEATQRASILTAEPLTVAGGGTPPFNRNR